MAMRQKKDRGGGEATRREFDQKVVEIKRVTRVVAGGKRMRFRALVVVGDHKGKVGMGLRKGTDVAEAVNKAVNAAKKNMVTVPLTNETIPHAIKLKNNLSKMLGSSNKVNNVKAVFEAFRRMKSKEKLKEMLKA